MNLDDWRRRACVGNTSCLNRKSGCGTIVHVGSTGQRVDDPSALAIDLGMLVGFPQHLMRFRVPLWLRKGSSEQEFKKFDISLSRFKIVHNFEVERILKEGKNMHQAVL